jgi:hypothetical protein
MNYLDSNSELLRGDWKGEFDVEQERNSKGELEKGRKSKE